MSDFGTPSALSAGSDSPDAPVVILFHGRGSNAQEIISLVPYLPKGPRYIAINAPIYENGGYAWFANRGIGRPTTESLAETTSWFSNWLSTFFSPNQRPLLIGNSGGGAFIGGLIGRDHSRYSGAALLYATLPWDAGIDFFANELENFPIFLAHGEQDRVIPADLLEKTWQYLVNESAATLEAHRGPEGHGLSEKSAAQLSNWITKTLRLGESRD